MCLNSKFKDQMTSWLNSIDVLVKDNVSHYIEASITHVHNQYALYDNKLTY